MLFMNMNKNPTTSELATLINREATEPCQLWVDQTGEVHFETISEMKGGPEETMKKSMARFGAWIPGTNHFGPKAAQDNAYLEVQLNKLKSAWRDGHIGAID
jgi:hypothetical protein